MQVSITLITKKKKSKNGRQPRRSTQRWDVKLAYARRSRRLIWWINECNYFQYKRWWMNNNSNRDRNKGTDNCKWRKFNWRQQAIRACFTMVILLGIKRRLLLAGCWMGAKYSIPRCILWRKCSKEKYIIAVCTRNDASVVFLNGASKIVIQRLLHVGRCTTYFRTSPKIISTNLHLTDFFCRTFFHY